MKPPVKCHYTIELICESAISAYKISFLLGVYMLLSYTPSGTTSNGDDMLFFNHIVLLSTIIMLEWAFSELIPKNMMM